MDLSLEDFCADKSYRVLELIGEGAYGIVWYCYILSAYYK